MSGSNEPRNTHWSYTALRAEYGEEGALEMLPLMPGLGQFSSSVPWGEPSDDSRPTYDTYVQSYPCHTDLEWIMPWDAWSFYGPLDVGPIYPDGVWMTARAPLADQAPRESKREAQIPQKWGQMGGSRRGGHSPYERANARRR